MLNKRRILPLLLIMGIAIAIGVNRLKPELKHEEALQPVIAVNVIEVQTQPLIPRTWGYGVVQPSTVLNATSEVNARVLWVHEELKKGAALTAGTELIIFDDQDYQLALLQAQADLAAQQANLDELKIRKKNTQSNLTLVQGKLDVAQKELKRLQSIAKKQALSQSQVDQQRTVVLSLQQERQQLQNELNILPTQQRIAQANAKRSQAKVEEQKRNILRTKITLPYTARIHSVDVEIQQNVRVGQALFSAHGIDQIEVSAQVPLEKIKPLVEGQVKKLQELNFEQRMNALQLSASIRLTGALKNIQWSAKVLRISEDLDPQTRTPSVIVAVDNPYQQAKVGVKPPLLSGMYVEVEISAPAVNSLVIPRSALHGNYVYLVDKQQKLHKQEVVLSFVQGDWAIISSGLENGDQLVISDVVPATEGILLEATVDEKTQGLIKSLAEPDGEVLL